MANTRLRSSLSSAGAQWKKHCALVACAAAGTLNLSDVIAQTQAPAEATPAPAGAASEPVAPEQQFSVFEMRVLGNTVLANQQIEKAVYPFLGEHKSFKDIEAARLALETAYKEAGYATVFVDIPEQDVGDDGVVRLRVTEGKLDRVRITGARYFSNGQLRTVLPALQHGEVPHLPTLQKELEAANRQARDRGVTPVLRAGRTPGTIDVELKVQDKLPVHGAVEANNRYTADTSKTRASLNLSYDNLWQHFHSFSMQYQTAPEAPEEARVIAGTYLMPVTQSGNMVALYAVDTNSDVATIGTLSVLGAGRIYGARYIVPLPQGENFFHSVSFGADYKDFEEGIRLVDGTRDRTPIDYSVWSVGYNGNLRSERSTASFNLSANFGMRAFGNEDDEFEFKRFKARPNFFHLRASTEYERQIFWGTRAFVRLAGQYTVEPLVSNEQFAIGGADSVRGYLESEALGDYGISGTLEWRTPSFSGWMQRFGSDLYLFAFGDAGVVSIIDALPKQDSRVDLSSVGLGMRIVAFGGLEAAIDGAYTLQSTDRTEAYDTRVHFQVRYGF